DGCARGSQHVFLWHKLERQSPCWRSVSPQASSSCRCARTVQAAPCRPPISIYRPKDLREESLMGKLPQLTINMDQVDPTANAADAMGARSDLKKVDVGTARLYDGQHPDAVLAGEPRPMS